MTNITTYDFIERNSKKTILLMILFLISFVSITYFGIFIVSVLKISENTQVYGHMTILSIVNQTAIYIIPIVSIIAILWILISYYTGQNFILSTAGAVKLTKQNAIEVINIVENIAITAGLPVPSVYAINDEGLNAFATGRDPSHSYIVLTKGIINKLEKSELEGVIAHEMAHIGNRDIKLMLIMVVCISFTTIVAEILLRYAFLLKTNHSKDNRIGGGIQLILFILAITLYTYGYLFAPLIKLTISRTREFQADATAALITRNPQGLINALKKISGNPIVKNLSDKQPLSPLCIANPLAKNKQKSFFAKISGLFATHPPIEERIKALQTMDSRR